MNNRELVSLAGKTALITGGSRGGGVATSKLLAARGANVIVNYFKNKEAADKVVDEIKRANKEAAGVRAQEFGKKVVTANMVSPELIETDQNALFFAEIKRRYASLTTIGRTDKSEDVANVIAFFTSNDCEYITGTYAPVDGGLVIGG